MVKTLVILMTIFLFATPAMASSVSLTWTAPTLNADGSDLADLGGYFLHRGSGTMNYTESVDVGNVTDYVWDVGNREGETMYFNVTAYDTQYNISEYNGEISVAFPLVAPAPPTNLQGVVVP